MFNCKLLIKHNIGYITYLCVFTNVKLKYYAYVWKSFHF